MVKHEMSCWNSNISHLQFLTTSYQFPTIFEQNIMLLHMEVSNIKCPVEIKEFRTFHFW